jgi:hypothetical protein
MLCRRQHDRAAAPPERLAQRGHEDRPRMELRPHQRARIPLAVFAVDRQRVGVVEEQEQPVAVLQLEQPLDRGHASQGIGAIRDIGHARVLLADVLDEVEVVVVSSAQIGLIRFIEKWQSLSKIMTGGLPSER